MSTYKIETLFVLFDYENILVKFDVLYCVRKYLLELIIDITNLYILLSYW